MRNPEEIAKKSVDGTLNVPLDALTRGELGGLPAQRDAPIVAMCARGKRSVYALLLLKAQGYANVKTLWGGIEGWSEAGLPVTRG